MALYSLTKNGNVVQCKWNCKCQHEHYNGSYEQAIKYFGIDQKEIQSWGNLKNIIIYHQTSQYTVPKLSNELYDILISAMAQHKYFVPLDKRKETAMQILDWAKCNNYIKDELICKTINKKAKNNIKQQRRVYMYELWCKQG